MYNEPQSIEQLKRFILEDISEIYPRNEAYSICRIILEHIGFPEMSILRDPSAPVADEQWSEIKKIVGELHKNKPIQYILGSTIFYDLLFKVDENVLIPRPETEELVSMILMEKLPEKARILDIGTGSGCIAISLAANIPESQVSALDVDDGALGIARQNAAMNHVDLDFIQQDILDTGNLVDGGPYDLIVSNPPYITEEEKIFMMQNVLKYEPHLALFVPDDDPLKFYRAIAAHAKKLLTEKGTLWFEINESYGNELAELLLQEGFPGTRLLKDIHGRDRFIKSGRE